MKINNVLLSSNIYKRWTEESGLKDRSIGIYKAGLTKFGEFIKEQGFDTSQSLDFDQFYYSKSTGHFHPIDLRFIDEFIATLIRSGATPSSLRATVDGLKSFFKFQYDHGLFSEDFMRFYPNRFYKPKLRDKRLTYEEVTALLDAAASMTVSTGEAYYLLILLMVTCGLRASEVCELREDQIRWEDHTIIVNRGQKTKASAVYMSKDLESELRFLFDRDTWINRKKKDLNPHVFYYKGRSLTYSRLRKMISMVVQATDDGPQHVTPHTFRYTMAALLCDEGINVSAIQRQMRHERLVTTFHYLGVDARAARNIIEENMHRLVPRLPEMIRELRELAEFLP